MTSPAGGRFRPRPHVHARRFDADVVVVDLAGGKYFALDEVGAVVWEKLVGAASVEEVVEPRVADYAVTAETARADVVRLVDALLAAGWLERAP